MQCRYATAGVLLEIASVTIIRSIGVERDMGIWLEIWDRGCPLSPLSRLSRLSRFDRADRLRPVGDKPLAIVCAIGLVLLAGCETPDTNASDAADTAADTAAETTSADAASEMQAGADGDAPSVVAVTGLLCDIATGIAGESIELACLTEPGQDPHSYRLKPSDLATIETADLVLYNGYSLMPGLADTIQSSEAGRAGSLAAIAVAELAVPEPMLFGGHEHGHDDEHDEHGHDDKHDEHDEHDGHAHAADDPDPHVWHDASHGGELVSIVADRLIELVPDRADEYRANADALQTQLASVHDWIGEQVATVPETNRTLVSTHDAFSYYTAAYGLTQTSALAGLSPLEKPSPAELAAIVDGIKTSGVPAIFAETTSSTQLVESVAREAGVKLAERSLLVDGPDPAVDGGATYPAMLAYNTCTIVEALGGTCDREALGF